MTLEEEIKEAERKLKELCRLHRRKLDKVPCDAAQPHYVDVKMTVGGIATSLKPLLDPWNIKGGYRVGICEICGKSLVEDYGGGNTHEITDKEFKRLFWRQP